MRYQEQSGAVLACDGAGVEQLIACCRLSCDEAAPILVPRVPVA